MIEHVEQLLRRGNDALRSNPPFADSTISTNGSSWLWAAFSLFALADLVALVWMLRLPRGVRTFHQLAVVVLTTASIAYFTMASNLGGVAVQEEFVRNGLPSPRTRAVWYVRYIDWTITTPLLLLEILLCTGLPLGDIFTVTFMDLVMIISGLVGALVVSTYKWGYFTFGCFAMFYVIAILLGPARASANRLGPDFGRAYRSSAVLLAFLWLLYPICWALSDGANVISPNGEMVFYGILDLLAKPVFIFWHLWQIGKLDYAALGLASGKYSEVGGVEAGMLNRPAPGTGLHGKHGSSAVAGTAAPAHANPAATTAVTNDTPAGTIGSHPAGTLGSTTAGVPVAANTTGTVASSHTAHPTTGSTY